jgi:hypothetical protein
MCRQSVENLQCKSDTNLMFLNQQKIKLVVLSGWLMMLGACTQQSLKTCATSGMFSDETSCKGGAAGSSCVMTTVQASSGASTVCWRMTSPTTVISASGSFSGSTDCNLNPWNVGSWSTCGTGVKNQTRSVTCKQGCNCLASAVPQPDASQPCPVSLGGNAHTTTECTEQSGQLFTLTEDYKNYCGFSGESCPSGWSVKKGSNQISYTITEPTTVNGWVNCSQTNPITSGYHAYFMNITDAVYSACVTLNSSTAGCSCSKTVAVKSKVTKILCY